MAFIPVLPTLDCIGPVRKQRLGAVSSWRPAEAGRKRERSSLRMETTAHSRAVPSGSKFCSQCATPMAWRVPDGDTHERLVCSSDECGRVLYKNPKITTAAVVLTADRKRVLLAQRKIEPFVGSWNIPGGFLEEGESSKEGATRECVEETNAQIHILDLLAVYDILAATQVQLVYLAVLLNEKDVAPGIESQDVGVFAWGDVPWDEIKLTTHKWALLKALNDINTSEPGAPVVPELRTKPIDYTE